MQLHSESEKVSKDSTFFSSEELSDDSIHTNFSNETTLFYDSLKIKASKNWFTKNLHSLFVKKNNDLTTNYLIEDQRKFFNLFKNRSINNIKLVKYNPLGSSKDDSISQTKSFAIEIANYLHFKTKDFVIKNNLIFKKGDLLTPSILSENERIIRNLPYIKDCKIVVKPNLMSTDSIDIEVRTKDIWSFIVKGHYFDNKKFDIELNEMNLLGLGHQVKILSYVDYSWKKRYGFEYHYDIENLIGTFTSLALTRKNLFKK